MQEEVENREIAILYLKVIAFLVFVFNFSPEHKKDKIRLSYRNGNATWYESFRYEPDPDAVWQTVAVGFDPSEGDVFVWSGGVSLGKEFEKEGSLTFTRPFFPNRCSVAFSAAVSFSSM